MKDRKWTSKFVYNFNALYFFLILIQIKLLFSQKFESFISSTLNNYTSLIDITDYFNIFPIITSDKKIYTNIPPIERNITSSKITKFSAAATYNKKTILIACTEDYLLSKIDIDSGEETPLVKYENEDINVNIPSFTCSISICNDYIYIGMSHKIVPYTKIKKENNRMEIINSDIIGKNNLNISDIFTVINNEEDNYDIIYDYINTYLANSVIKIKIKTDEENNGLLKDPSFNILNYTFKYTTKNSNIMDLSNPLSCEIVSSQLDCGYVRNFDNLYFAYIVVMNKNFDGIDEEKELYNSTSLLYLKLQKKDENSIYFIGKNCFIISLQNNGDKFEIISSKGSNFYSLVCTKNLFFYNNNYLFYVLNSNLTIKKDTTDNYFSAQENKDIQKIIGYYREENDTFLLVYENSMNIIKYFTIQNIGILFQYKIEKQIIKVTSNTTTNYNVSQLIKEPLEHYLLSFLSLIYYIGTSNYNYSYDYYNFDEENQILKVEPSLNDWISFTFYIEGGTRDIPTGFYFDEAKVIIKTCQFKCGSCYEDFDHCDNGTCKANFSLVSYLGEEQCYSIDQNFPNYIYNKTTNKYEKCFPNCKFCNKNSELSTSSHQNCKVCDDGYMRSYTFLGNCYKINSTQKANIFSKIINNIDDEEFEIVESCPESKKYKIDNTGECVEYCPKAQVYYSYKLNTSFKFSDQEESYMGLLYPLYKEMVPKYLFNGMCYLKCPYLTKVDEKNKVCKCKYGWHNNSTLNETICYDNKDYCLSYEFYYHTDTKECVLSGCKEGYLRLNFECYKEECPKDTKEISGKRCDSTKNYCYINEKYQTICGNSKYEEYNFKYNDTKTYLKLCNDSMYYFNVKTYLYKNVCYENCPEETSKNDKNVRCSCIYYIYYMSNDKSDYECLNSTEKCMDKKRYNISEKEECVDSKQKCFDDDYYVFNYDCLKDCPNNTKALDNHKNCLCQYNYYNESNFLTCFDEGVTCEDQNYPIKKYNSNECFITKDECIKRGFKFFNNICYESCTETPVNTIETNNDGICRCVYYYYNDTDILNCLNQGETCDKHSYNYTYVDTNKCFSSLKECTIRKLKIFNNNCYNECPENTKQKSGDSTCICSNYFYKELDGILNCFGSDKKCITEGYQYTNPETKECFKSEEECIKSGYKIFNKECYEKCPPNSEEKSNNKCECSSYYTIDENNIFKCFSSEVDCASQNYYFNREKKLCFISKEICFNENKKIFGKECLDNCPLNSNINEEENTCKCLYNYFNDDGILNCFIEGQTCENKSYLFTSDDTSNKECFLSIGDCIKKGYSYFFNKTCFKMDCPPDKIPLNTITDSLIKKEIINDLHLDSTIENKLCICDTKDKYYGWVLKENTGTYTQYFILYQ